MSTMNIGNLFILHTRDFFLGGSKWEACEKEASKLESTDGNNSAEDLYNI